MYDFGDMDTYGGPGLILPARALEIIDHKLHKWPGHGLADDVRSYQFQEAEYNKAAEETVKWQKITGEVSRTALEAGYPGFSGGFSGAPFDMLTDMLRGTTGLFMDMYRQPGKNHEARERLGPI